MAISLMTIAKKVYSSAWIQVGKPEGLEESLKSQIKSMKITQGEFGNSLRLDLLSGDFCFLDMDVDDNAPVGYVPKFEEIQVITLKKGDEQIYRVRTSRYKKA